MVVGTADELVARADWRVRRRGHGPCGTHARVPLQLSGSEFRPHRRMAFYPEDDCGSAFDRDDELVRTDDHRVLALPQLHSVANGQVLPEAATGLSRRVQPF